MGLFGTTGFMQRERYRRHLRRMLREKHESGEIATPDYERAMRASLKNSTIEKVIAESRQPTMDGSNLKGDFSWTGIWDWICENWFEILKIVITVAILFADDDSEREFYGDGTLCAETGPKDQE